MTQMNYLFSDSFRPRALRELTDFLNSCEPKTVQNIYLYGEKGGEVSLAFMFKNLLEKRTTPVNLYGTGYLYSAALIAFMFTDVPRVILEGTVGMWHHPFAEVRVTTKNKKIVPDLEFDIYTKTKSGVIDYMDKLIQPTATEKKLLNEGKDLYLNTERLNKMLKRSKKDKYDF